MNTSLLNQHYIPLRRIGAGGMGEVFLARQTGEAGFDREVALKRMHHQLGEHPAAVQMFLKEARLAAALSHPNVVQIFDVGQEEGSFYIAMEHVRGTDLRTLAEAATHIGRMIPLENSINIIVQVLDGLRFAHGFRGDDGQLLGVVHGDIGPNNILISVDGVVKLVDFGLAAAEGEMRAEGGLHAGKLAYMSPEVMNGHRVDGRSDLFSVGILLYELTVGQRLFRVTSFESLRRVMAEPIIPPSFTRPSFPPALETIIMRSLEMNPRDRYPSAVRMLEDLESFAHSARLRLSRLNLGRYMSATVGVLDPYSDVSTIGMAEPLPLEPEAPEEPTQNQPADDLDFDGGRLFDGDEEEDLGFDVEAATALERGTPGAGEEGDRTAGPARGADRSSRRARTTPARGGFAEEEDAFPDELLEDYFRVVGGPANHRGFDDSVEAIPVTDDLVEQVLETSAVSPMPDLEPARFDEQDTTDPVEDLHLQLLERQLAETAALREGQAKAPPSPEVLEAMAELAMELGIPPPLPEPDPEDDDDWEQPPGDLQAARTPAAGGDGDGSGEREGADQDEDLEDDWLSRDPGPIFDDEEPAAQTRAAQEPSPDDRSPAPGHAPAPLPAPEGPQGEVASAASPGSAMRPQGQPARPRKSPRAPRSARRAAFRCARRGETRARARGRRRGNASGPRPSRRGRSARTGRR